MSKGVHDIFALMINILGINWQSKHFTLGFFEITNTSQKTLAKNLIELLKIYNLDKKILLTVKMKDNFNTMIVPLN
jgi:hypothetical protein